MTRSLGLVLAGFILGTIVSNLNAGVENPGEPAVAPKPAGEYAQLASDYRKVAATAVWDVFVEDTADGRGIALGQDGLVRVEVRDDQSALYVMTYKAGDPVWQGRLMDVGNDGIVEVADLSYGHCEAFSPARVDGS